MVNGSQYGETETVTQGSSPSFTAPSYNVSSYNAHAYEFLGWNVQQVKAGDPAYKEPDENSPVQAGGTSLKVESPDVTVTAVWKTKSRFPGAPRMRSPRTAAALPAPRGRSCPSRNVFTA